MIDLSEATKIEPFVLFHKPYAWVTVPGEPLRMLSLEQLQKATQDMLED